MRVGSQNSRLIISQKTGSIQVDEQGLPSLFPSHAEPVSDLNTHQGIGVGGSANMPQSLLVNIPDKFCISTTLLYTCDLTHPFK